MTTCRTKSAASMELLGWMRRRCAQPRQLPGQVANAAGFDEIDIEPTRIYRAADARQFLDEARLANDEMLAQVDGRFMSAFIRAEKPVPAPQACCGPTCCS